MNDVKSTIKLASVYSTGDREPSDFNSFKATTNRLDVLFQKQYCLRLQLRYEKFGV